MTQILFLFVTRFRHFEFPTIESWDVQRGKGIPISIQEEDESRSTVDDFLIRTKGGEDSARDAERHTRVRALRGRKVERGRKDTRTMNARISARFVRKIAPRGPAVHVPRRGDGWTRWERGGVLSRRSREEKRRTAAAFSRSLPPRRILAPHLSPRFSEPKLFSCLSFVPVSSERASLAATALLVLSSSFSFRLSFFLSFFFSLLCAISLPIHRCLGPWKGSRLRQLERRARRGRKEGTAAEAFSNRIPHCRLGNSRRIEITHYPVMSDAFTSTRGCTRGGESSRICVRISSQSTRPWGLRTRNDVTFTWSSSWPSLDRCANGVTRSCEELERVVYWKTSSSIDFSWNSIQCAWLNISMAFLREEFLQFPCPVTLTMKLSERV